MREGKRPGSWPRFEPCSVENDGGFVSPRSMKTSYKQTTTNNFVVQLPKCRPDHGESPLVRKVGWQCRIVSCPQEVFTEPNSKASKRLIERINSKVADWKIEERHRSLRKKYSFGKFSTLELSHKHFRNGKGITTGKRKGILYEALKHLDSLMATGEKRS